MHDVSEDFARCWQAAGRHLSAQVQGPISWLKANLSPPFLEHLSFRLGNQLFYIRIVDVDSKLTAPGTVKGLFTIAEGCNGHACLMPMQLQTGSWAPAVAGWGLVDAKTRRAINPIDFVTDEKIEMTDWELHDFAVQIVRDQLIKDGKKLMSSQGTLGVDPSMWFVGDHGPEWVVVRSARHPKKEAHRPENMPSIAASCARMSNIGHFASVTFANSDDAFDPSGNIPALPIWRGYGARIRFEGLEPVAIT